MFNGWEWMVVLIVGILIFGNRLPGIARSMGRSVVEFKKGMRDIDSAADEAAKNGTPEKPALPADSQPKS